MTAADASPTLAPAADSARRAGRWWQGVWPWAAALLSGALLVLCLAPWDQEWLCWLALTPLVAAVWFAPEPALLPVVSAPASRPGRMGARLVRLWQRRGVRCFLLGYACGLVYIWGAFSWLRTVTVPGWFILGPYMACYPAVWCVFVGALASPGPTRLPAAGWRAAARPTGGGLFVWNPAPASNSRLLRSRWNLWFAFLAAAAWVGLEWVRGWLLSGFGWNNLGVALHANLPFIQIAEYTGVGGLSFLAAFVNVIAVATVGRFVLEVRAHRVRPHFDFTLAVAVLMLVFAFGIRTLRRSQLDAARPGAGVPLRVAAIQAGVPQDEKWNPERAGRITQLYDDLSATALATRPQLLLWPEAATPYGMFDSRGRTMEDVGKVVRAGGCSLLFGTLDYDFGPDGHAQADYNAAMMVVPGQEHVQIYRKIHLVPYGEYVPYRKEFPPFAWIVGDQVPGDFAFGSDPTVFETADPQVRVAPLICFEDTIGELARRPVLGGAQLLVNVTNDAWFQRTAASRQHLHEAIFRTVENRRPLVRCANTGVTAFVDRDGRITPQTLLLPDGKTVFGQGILTGLVDVPTTGTLTFYTRHGEVFSVACTTVAGLAVFFAGWRSLRRVRIRRPATGATEAAA